MTQEQLQKGRWTKVFDLQNVPVHVSLLPNGKVLHWGRRDDPNSKNPGSLDEHHTKSYVWTPASGDPQPSPDNPNVLKLGSSQATANEPLNQKGKPVNLFCSGHCFLPNGKLFVVGGHLRDGLGLSQACTYDHETNQWAAQAPMNDGRWYPSALPLPDGRVLCMSGSDTPDIVNNIAEIWSPETSQWTEVTDAGAPLDLYPRIHLDRKGAVFMAGPTSLSRYLQIKDPQLPNGPDITDAKITTTPKPVGVWSIPKDKKNQDLTRTEKFRDYAPSVMYNSGEIMYIGGGSDGNASTTTVEFINLNVQPLEWKSSSSTNLKFPRKQFNATLLPDGQVLVTGGTRGPGFNDLGGSNPQHVSEMYDPYSTTPTEWKLMAEESVDRCYHSVALLLRDGRVLSAGGGEYSTINGFANAQLFEPPYCMKTRPSIVSAPLEIKYKQEILITVGVSDKIDSVSFMRLGSVTHCRNMNQSFMFLKPVKVNGSSVTVTAPDDASLATPGHYMLFVLTKDRVPSEGFITHLSVSAPDTASVRTGTVSARVADPVQHATADRRIQPTLREHNERIMGEQDRPPVVVGLTPLCPYGLGPCWGGAYHGLQAINDVDIVRPVPHQDDSLAYVYTQQDSLPDIDVWRSEFESVANKSYNMRGIEVTVSGVVNKTQSDAGEKLTLAGTSTRPQLPLARFQQTSQLKWDMKAEAARPITGEEAGAYSELSAKLADHLAVTAVQVTGTLQKEADNQYYLEIRDFQILDAPAS